MDNDTLLLIWIFVSVAILILAIVALVIALQNKRTIKNKLG